VVDSGDGGGMVVDSGDGRGGEAVQDGQTVAVEVSVRVETVVVDWTKVEPSVVMVVTTGQVVRVV
jgi:hypothetical protein